MDIVTRKQLNMLIQLAEADKHFSSVEREQIFEIARKRKFPMEEVKALIQNPEPLDSLGALSQDQKFEYLYSCIDLMLIDRRIFESEVIFCKNVADMLGFKREVVDFLKTDIHSHPKDELKDHIFATFT